MDDKTIGATNQEGEADNVAKAPLALLFCSDLMFAVRLKNMAKKSGYRIAPASPGTDIPDAGLLLVDIADRGDWETIIRQATEGGIMVIAFGPHMDSVARGRAKAAGATRVLANSNLERDLPGILVQIRDSLNTLHDRARSTQG